LLFPADRIAWLALLRAPWCGLSLADLTRFAAGQIEEGEMVPTLAQRIAVDGAELALSPEGQRRLRRVADTVVRALAERRRSQAFPGIGTLRFWVESCWRALGGPATLPNEGALHDARRYFALLAESERGGDLPDWNAFARKVASLYAGVDENADGGLAIMTIHKAKGLEFDCVILPGLERTPRVEERRLLSWQLLEHGLLLGPLKRVDQEEEDPIQGYIRFLDQKKANHEAKRLLYVAVTRAKQELHLLARLPKVDKAPAARSFLAMLWPMLEVEALQDGQDESLTQQEVAPPRPLRVLASDWQSPPLPPPVQTVAALRTIVDEPVEFAWAGEVVRLVGIVVHRFLQIIIRDGLHAWTPERIVRKTPAFQAHLQRLGLPDEPMERALAMVREALVNTLRDDRGRWILDDRRHQDAHSEYALTAVLHGRLQHVILDRTFIDREGVRWIIDFKSSWHSGVDREAFFDNEQQRYQEQLARYGAALRANAAEPICLGLYFPLHGGWRSWNYTA
jgi:ATP-dependent exoDNAse (exonuclease V) beta subunit